MDKKPSNEKSLCQDMQCGEEVLFSVILQKNLFFGIKDTCIVIKFMTMIQLQTSSNFEVAHKNVYKGH